MAKVPYLLLPFEGIWQLNHNICDNIIETLKNDLSKHEQPRVPRREVSFEGSMYNYLSLKLKIKLKVILTKRSTFVKKIETKQTY